MSEYVDKNCLSYWFPKLEAAGVPVPKTIILHMPEDCRKQIQAWVNGSDGGSAAVYQFVDNINSAAKSLGYPAFLRTGQTSHKHQWSLTCFMPDDKDTLNRITGLVEFSEIADFIGLNWSVWAVREMLPTKPLAILPNYQNFPLVKEVRCFVGGGKVLCSHPYWPEGAILEGVEADYELDPVAMTDADESKLLAAMCANYDDGYRPIAQKVAIAFADDESFSVDLLPTDRGWFVTDMALANRSFHWAGCEFVSD